MKKINTSFKKEFPALTGRFGGKKLVYLDNACTALKMRTAAEAQKAFLLENGFCGGKRSAHLPAVAVEEAFFEARRTVARFMGAAQAEEIIFTAGTTDAFNLFLSSFPFEGSRKEVIISPLEHNAVFLPLLNMAKRGRIRLRVIPLKNWAPDPDAYRKLLSAKTALVCLNRASNIFGGLTDTVPFARLAKQSGARVFLDAAQSLPTHAENVRSVGADACAFSGHKLGAPFGTGALYVERSLMERLAHGKVGGGTLREVSRAAGGFRVEYLNGYQGFEPGVQNYAGAVALAASIDTLLKAGMPAIRARVADLVAYGLKRLLPIKAVRVEGDRTRLGLGSIIPLASAKPGFSPVDFNLYLNHALKGRIIALRTGRHCADLAAMAAGVQDIIRLSFFAYNTREDIDSFVGALEEYISIL
ncbi:MAG: aminotransferase class V-fold PLP-dependent enzyme [Elusimicrobia bacterium]|nr:aminotransferase class V-fold PLP-dependent enzyme [Elusimicrobiota bacterium]